MVAEYSAQLKEKGMDLSAPAHQKFAEYLSPLRTVTASWYVRSSVWKGSDDITDGHRIADPFLRACIRRDRAEMTCRGSWEI